MQISGSVGIIFPDGTTQTTAASGGGGSVTGVTAVAPLTSSGGVSPAISLTGIVPVANGGTGVATLSGLLFGNGTGAMTAASPAQVSAALGTTPVGKANFLSGGLANEIPFQTAPGVTSFLPAPSVTGTFLGWNGTAFAWAAAGTGSVTGVSVVSANGFAGTVATSSTTPAITLTTSITGVLKGDGTAISAAAASDITTLLGSTAVGSATNLAGGGAGQMPYQTAAGTTAFTTAGTTGQQLTYSITNTPVWTTPANLTPSSAFVTTPAATAFNTNTAITLDLAAQSSAGTYGSSISIPVITVNSQGIITAASSQATVGVTYKGVWNGTTNTPTLANGVGTQGFYYICNVAGTTDFGAGSITFAIGDWAVYDGATWSKVDNSQTTAVNNFTISGIPQYTTIIGGGSSTVLTGVGPGTAGYVLTSNGAAANPSYQALGTMAAQNASAVAITGGTIGGVAINGNTIDNTVIGGTTALAITGTTITATKYVGIAGGTF
jgi:hypothetical protein